MMTYNNFYSVQALHAGGWRVTDREQLRTEYDLTPDELDDICEGLAALEEERQHAAKNSESVQGAKAAWMDSRKSSSISSHAKFLAAYRAAHLAKYGTEFDF